MNRKTPPVFCVVCCKFRSHRLLYLLSCASTSAAATTMGNRPPKLSREDLNALLDKTCFTKTQIKQWYKGFMVSNNILCLYLLLFASIRA